MGLAGGSPPETVVVLLFGGLCSELINQQTIDAEDASSVGSDSCGLT